MAKRPKYSEKIERTYNIWKTVKGRHYINPVLIPSVTNIRGKIPAFLGLTFVYIGRKSGDWLQSKWANPYRMHDHSNAERTRVLQEYEQWLKHQFHLLNAWKELVIRTLGCWCAPSPCHGEILRNLVIKRLSEFDNKATITVKITRPYIGE